MQAGKYILGAEQVQAALFQRPLTFGRVTCDPHGLNVATKNDPVKLRECAAAGYTCLLTLVERSSGIALVAKLPHRTSKAVNRATLKLIRDNGLPFKTITWDNGTEFRPSLTPYVLPFD